MGSKGPHTGFRDGPNKTGFKETSEGPKPEDLRPVSQGPRLMVSEGPGRVLECSRLLSDSGPWAGLRKTWNRSQRALNVVSEGPGAVSEEPKVCEPI